MKALKNIFLVLFSCGLFIAIQCIATLVALIHKVNIDPSYGENLLLAIDNLDMSNLETYNQYLSLCFEIIPMTMIITSALVLIPISIYLYKKKIPIIKKISLRHVIELFSLAIVLNIVVSAVVELLPASLTSDYASSTGYLQELSFVPMLLSVGVLAPIIEELFFRFLMVRRLRNKPALAIILPALLFGIVHGNIVQGSYAFILGMFFAVLYLKTDNLLVTILLHMGINSSSVFFSFLPVPVTVLIVILCFVFTFYSIYRESNLHKNIWKVLLKMNVKIPVYLLKMKSVNRKNEKDYEIVKKLADDINKKLNVKIVVSGRENLEELREPFVLYSNHRGMYDPVLIASQIEKELSFVLKKELQENKTINDLAILTNSVYFGRTPKEDLQTIIEMSEKSKNGVNYMIFPEGKRSTESQLQEYKGGSFKIPEKSHCDILPVVLYNTENIFDKHGNDKKVYISFLSPIHYEEYKDKKALELSRIVQKISQDEYEWLEAKH